MKHHGLAITLFVIFSSLFNVTQARQTVNIGYSEYKPYMSQSLPHKGLLNHIVKESFALEGITANFTNMSSSKIFKLIENGKLDASVGWTPTKNRERFADFSDPIFTSKVVLFYRKNNPVHWSAMPAAKKVIMGATKTYVYGEQFELAKQQGHIKVQLANSDKINFKKLIGTRIDAFPIALDVGQDMLSRKFSKRQRRVLTFSPEEIYSEPLTLMFSKSMANNKNLVASFNRGFSKLKQNGDYQKILQKFNTRLNKQR